MRFAMVLAVMSLIVSACASAPAKSFVPRNPAATGELIDPSDPRLVDSGADPMTIWKAVQMTQTADGRAQLDEMFDQKAVSLNRLPIGYAAGAGLPTPDLPLDIDAVTTMITGSDWRGKIFCSFTPYETHGLNRIVATAPISSSVVPVVPMAAFRASLITPEDPRNLATTAKTNLVVLNYSHPSTSGQHKGIPYPVELALLAPHVGQVYDVMVAIPGKYGPMYLGKTWVGTYDSNGDFHSDRDTLIARYFLDFNPGALQEQKLHHWPKGQAENPTSDKNDCQGVKLP